jgi:hypothetical protein
MHSTANYELKNVLLPCSEKESLNHGMPLIARPLRWQYSVAFRNLQPEGRTTVFHGSQSLSNDTYS